MPAMPRTFCATENAEGMADMQTVPRVTLIGHPFSPIGTGRAARVTFAAFRSVGIDTRVRDAWQFLEPEDAQVVSIVPFLTTTYSAMNIFHINGDEVAPVLERIGPLPPGYNIIVPFWELPRYPAEWACQLQRFDEVWAGSHYLRRSIAAAVDRPVVHMPLATEIALDTFRGRRWFGIAENSYAFLFFFDGRSYIERKNPQAVVDCFRRLLASRPWARTCLVIKVHRVEAEFAEVREFLAGLADLRERVVVLEATMPEVEVHNLIRCCDAFVSLHRAEGFGHGLAEAMYLGRPVIGTGYSGNMDFMTPENSIPIGYRLIPVASGSYPHAEDQHWADPDLDEAVMHMIRLLDDPAAGRALGRTASRCIRTAFSYRASGLRYKRRLGEIADAAADANQRIESDVDQAKFARA
jgi:glycosyltransferase involved in cell wall biosynthesis